jgi:small subunit ribosomal protein S3|uniref:Small ribosomal subunit protein uS3c n=1 Tax=Didymosphenia geminata TaxID=1115533 RepID=A0A023HB70_9STRA|nr:ribosomal protein S3 [Didymosphenia geminata]AGH28789.1 ribosomal protein S3 [Didymosphenia geminata]
MGQKTHPLGFRLGTTQEHKSIWYSNFNQYAKILKEDDTIRTYIKTISKAKSIANVKINRNGLNDQIQLNIETGKPGILVGDLGVGLETLLSSVKKLLPANRQLTINVFEVEKVDLDASLLADLVAEQLEKRVAFRRAIREALQRAQKQNVNGIKIQVSGRLNGAEIARSEWIREGRVPLQTLRADIDYATQEANTIYGVLGIKVWLFKSEILSK